MKLIPVAILLFSFLACSKKNNTTLQNLPPSIQAIISGAEKNCPACGLTVTSYNYNGEVVYEKVCNGPACDCILFLYNHKGELIEYHKEKYEDINARKVLIKELFRGNG